MLSRTNDRKSACTEYGTAAGSRDAILLYTACVLLDTTDIGQESNGKSPTLASAPSSTWSTVGVWPPEMSEARLQRKRADRKPKPMPSRKELGWVGRDGSEGRESRGEADCGPAPELTAEIPAPKVLVRDRSTMQFDSM